VGKKAKEQGWVKTWVNPSPIMDPAKDRERPVIKPMGERVAAKTVSEDEVEAIIEQVANGITLKAACEDAGIKYLSMYEIFERSPSLSLKYSHAKELFVQNRVDHMHFVAAHEPDVQRARLVTDLTKWEASKILGRIYGDSKTINVSGGLNVTDSRDELIKELLQLRGKGAAKVLENVTDVTEKPRK
jgi:hypothetical protein